MTKRLGFRATLLLLVFAVSSVGQAEPPPRDLHWTGDHWSAWSPPAAPPEDAEVYEIVRGDTLWDLAERFLGDPYLWPQIWERNRYIGDSHWIYPGDPLVIGMTATPIAEVEAMTDEAEAAASAGGPGRRAGSDDLIDRAPLSPEALGSSGDIDCSGFIGEPDRPFERHIIGSEYEHLQARLGSGTIRGRYGVVDTVKVDLSVGDIVYVDGGIAAGLYPGAIYTAVSPRDAVVHPTTGRNMGIFYRYTGRVRILSVQQETAIAEIVHSCDPMHVGNYLEPYEAQPVPLARRPPLRAVNDPQVEAVVAQGPVIVRSLDRVISLGQGHLVFIDRGQDDGVAPGDIFTIYRLNSPGIPPVVVGELGVLATESGTAVARILESRHTVFIGDRLDLER